MNKIYVIWVVQLNEEGLNINRHTIQRTWGWFSKFEDAEDIVLNNKGDIFEFYYNYACIEEVEEGLYTSHKVIGWYQANYIDSDKNVFKMELENVEKVEAPKYANGMANFSMG